MDWDGVNDDGGEDCLPREIASRYLPAGLGVGVDKLPLGGCGESGREVSLLGVRAACLLASLASLAKSTNAVITSASCGHSAAVRGGNADMTANQFQRESLLLIIFLILMDVLRLAGQLAKMAVFRLE